MKKIQLGTFELEAEYHRALYDLEQKFQPKHDALFKKRTDIVSGSYEPTDEECKLSGVIIPANVSTVDQEKPTGIPLFWLTVLKNVHEIGKSIQKCDEEVLQHLIDIRAYSKQSPETLTFQLDFEFKTNEFFQNSVLTKTYMMKCEPDLDDPYSFEGPEIFMAIGCNISWNDGMNVIEKSTKKDPNTPFFETSSFFNFFNPPQPIAELDDDLIEVKNLNVTQYFPLKTFSFFFQTYLENDFELGNYLKERVIPRAVLFYTNEIEDDISCDVSADDPLDLVGANYDIESDDAREAAGDGN